MIEFALVIQRVFLPIFSTPVSPMTHLQSSLFDQSKTVDMLHDIVAS